MSTTKNTKSSSRSAGGASSARRKSASGAKGASASRAATARNSASASEQQNEPLRREIGALVCLLLCIFSAFGYFKIKAIFITFFCSLLKGLFGYGFWIAPPALLLASGILLFHRGKPVRRRLIATLLLPFLFGALVHVLFAAGKFGIGFKQIPLLWTSGLAMQCGGAIGGWISGLFCTVFSRIGAALLFLLALFVCDMIITKITPVDIFDAVRAGLTALAEFLRSRPAYEEAEEEPNEDIPRVTRPGEGRPSRVYPPPVPRRTRRSSIDIPLDEDSALGADGAAQKSASGRPEKYFNATPGVRAPHEVLQEQTSAAQNPARETEQVPQDQTAQMLNQQLESVFADIPVEESKPARVARTQKPAVRKVESEEDASAKLKMSEAAHAAARVREMKDSATYEYPSVYLLDKSAGVSNAAANEELRTTRELLDDTIQSFGIDARIINVTRGPSVTRYELELMRGVKLNKLTNLAGDIALSLGVSNVRIAPITGRNSVVGVEVPNQLVTPVPVREVIDSAEFRKNMSKVSFAVGKDISGKCIVGNIAKLPHMLIAGTTGSGKSVCTNSLIISLLYKSGPEDVRLIMVDPKMVELGIYNGIPHLLIPVVTDPKKAAGALQWAVTEMMKRYRLFSEIGVRDLSSYNQQMIKNGESKLPQIVVVIDELADLMIVAAKEVEESICRVAQMGRAAGMHLIIATQRPSSDVITGLMKANIPSRIAFAVASSLESRIILDTTGAEKLVGKGDMLYSPLGIGKPLRVQGCMISDEEVAKVVAFIKENSSENYDNSVMAEVESNAQKSEKNGKGSGGSSAASSGADAADSGDTDELLPAAIEVVVETGMASVSMLQRRLKLGYSRAARLVDQMEERKIVGPFEGSKPRQVLVTKTQWDQIKLKHTGSSSLSATDEYAAALAMSEAADAEAGMPEYPLDGGDDADGFDSDAPF